MKLNLIDENEIIIYLNKYYILDINFKDKDELEDYFRCLFLNLKKNYNISFNGYYLISVYVDNFYGCVISLEKEDFEYYDSFTNQIDMRISVIDTFFLYEIDDPYNFKNFDNLEIYSYKNKFYLKNESNDFNTMSTIIEHSNIIYENTEDIVYKSTLITI